MKITVLGSQGMAGHMITKYFQKQGYSVATVARNNADFNLDIENTAAVEDFFTNYTNCDWMINCIGLLVNDSEINPARALLVNSWFPRFLEKNFLTTQTRIIHLSTDCVFDGTTGFYKETDMPTESNMYGKSKAIGEIINNKDITFRTSIIGPELKSNGTGLFEWTVNKSSQNISGWYDSHWNGMTTLQLAKCIENYIRRPVCAGLYHLVGGQSITKFDLLDIIVREYKLDKIVAAVKGPKPINKILVDTRQCLNLDIPNYQTQICELRSYTTA